jgi:hypothetical protein
MTADQIAAIIDPAKTTMLDVHYGDHDEFFENLYDGFRILNEAQEDHMSTADWWEATKPTIVIWQGRNRIGDIKTPAELIALQQAHFDLYTNI